MSRCVDTIGFALSLMREALSLLDDPDAASIAYQLRLAIEAAEKLTPSQSPVLPPDMSK